jgi:hypothetical protein
MDTLCQNPPRPKQTGKAAWATVTKRQNHGQRMTAGVSTDGSEEPSYPTTKESAGS